MIMGNKTMPTGTGYCSNCKIRVDISWQDHGIGAYEYWGARGIHQDIRACCSECGEELDDLDTQVIDEYDIWNDERI